MPKRFWSSSQKPKKNWEQYTSRDSPSSKPTVKPLSTQERSKGRRGKMEWGFDPWASPPTSVSPTSVSQNEQVCEEESSGSNRRPGVPYVYPNAQKLTAQPQSARNAIKQRLEYKELHQRRKERYNSAQSQNIIPGVSKMTTRQILSVVFSAFWDRADLYTDVLGLSHDNPTPRQLKLAFFRQGRVILATPIESPDDMTLLSAGMNGIMNGNSFDAGSTVSVVQAGTPISRKAKLKFQAVSLAYEVLRDDAKRKAYDEWKMWNSRLPPPPPPPPSPQPAENDFLSDSQKVQPQTYDPEISSPPLKYRPSGTDDAMSITSILRKPTTRRRRRLNKKTKPVANVNRKITWNEEVEEVTITETLPPYDPLVDDLGKENNMPMNYHGVTDPYGDSAEDWFGTVDNDLPEYDKAARRRDRNKIKAFKGDLFSQQNDFIYDGGFNSKNFESLNSKTVVPMEDPSSGTQNEEYNPNDSLMLILDGPDAKQPQEKQCAGDAWYEQWSKNACAQNFFNDGDGNGQQDRAQTTRAIATPIAAASIVGDSAAKSQQDKQQSNNIESLNKELTITGLPVLPKNHHIIDDDGGSLSLDEGSYQSNDFTASWESGTVGTIGTSGTMEGQNQQSDCDLGRTVDLARGFQATLSNYINAAVEDMKEGLQMMGSRWDELELTGSNTSSEKNKNFFFLDTNELDAMMDILKTEMDTLSGQCGARQNTEPVQTNARRAVPITPERNRRMIPITSPEKSRRTIQETSAEQKPTSNRFLRLFSKSS